MKRRVFRGLAAFAVVAAGLALAGCAGDLNPVRDVFVATGIGEGPREAPEFISQTRPAASGYLPIGQTAPARDTTPKTDEELAEMEVELRRLRDRNTASAASARALASSPAPEPVIVEPVPALEPSPRPPQY
ncbi:MAG: hypothetical protein EA385_09705 [Salinarimonadaceae bacterium]|nr:MAG: hypothetical protein EA385_09705 [Salinarimonadaceae bacterium]